MEVQYEALRQRYLRLRHAAQEVVDGCEAVRDEHPRCGVAPHLIRTLRRELDGEPQPRDMTWMSVT